MAGPNANVNSIEALRKFKAALALFAEEVEEGMVALELEGRRPMEWIEHDRAQYWPREERKANDSVAEARLALQKAESTIDATETKYCHDERKRLEKCKRRWRLCEEKVAAVKRWRPRIGKETMEFQVQVAKVRTWLESDFVRSIAQIERMIGALDRYVQQAAPDGGESASTSKKE
jgi:hypothetical protein